MNSFWRALFLCLLLSITAQFIGKTLFEKIVLFCVMYTTLIAAWTADKYHQKSK